MFSLSLSDIKIVVDRENPPLASSPLYVMVIQILGHQYVVLVFHQHVVGVLLMKIAIEKQICPVYNGQGHFSSQ